MSWGDGLILLIAISGLVWWIVHWATEALYYRYVRRRQARGRFRNENLYWKRVK